MLRSDGKVYYSILFTSFYLNPTYLLNVESQERQAGKEVKSIIALKSQKIAQEH